MFFIGVCISSVEKKKSKKNPIIRRGVNHMSIIDKGSTKVKQNKEYFLRAKLRNNTRNGYEIRGLNKKKFEKSCTINTSYDSELIPYDSINTKGRIVNRKMYLMESLCRKNTEVSKANKINIKNTNYKQMNVLRNILQKVKEYRIPTEKRNVKLNDNADKSILALPLILPRTTHAFITSFKEIKSKARFINIERKIISDKLH